MNSMEAVVSLCTTLQRIEENSAKFHEEALVAKENGEECVVLYFFSYFKPQKVVSLSDKFFWVCLVVVV